MELNGRKLFLVAKIKHKTSRLNNATANKNPNFDIANFKTGIKADFDEMEQCVKMEIDKAASKSEVEELAKEILELQKATEDALEEYEG